jgi:uncharacterized protein (TIGR03067 family)
MPIRAFALCVATFLGVDARGEDKDDDAKKLVGAWVCDSATNNGKALPAQTVKQLRLTITKDGGYKTERDKEVLFDSTYKIDSGKKPKHIDLIGTEGENKGKAAQGIYAIEDDTLRICYTMPGQKRPTQFESKVDSGTTLVVWKRSKE